MTRVLVVEPDLQLRTFIAGILGDFGHHVAQCADVGQAVQSLAQSRFDVIATDLVLGTKVHQFLARAPRLRVLSLIGRPVFPADDNPYDRPPTLHDKPFRFNDLTMLVAAVDERNSEPQPVAGRARG